MVQSDNLGVGVLIEQQAEPIWNLESIAHGSCRRIGKSTEHEFRTGLRGEQGFHGCQLGRLMDSHRFCDQVSAQRLQERGRPANGKREVRVTYEARF